MKTEAAGGSIFCKPDDNINIPLSLDCGQAFRWRPDGEGGFHAVVRGSHVGVSQRDGGLLFTGFEDEAEFLRIAVPYFDLNRSYAAIEKTIESDRYVAEAMKTCRGLRILRQEPFETLISFIVSQNNNVPRIKRIIEGLCQLFGEPAGGPAYSFPSPERLAVLDESDLSPLRCGYRARYIIDASRKVASGELDLEAASGMDEDECLKLLKSVTGVGDKVASCIMLFGMGKLDVFPLDVWMKRVVKLLYGGSPDVRARFGGYAGVAQQYLFVLARQERFLERLSREDEADDIMLTNNMKGVVTI